MTAIVSVNVGLPKDVQKAEKFAPVRGSLVEIPAGQLLSVNVGLPREIEWKGKTIRTAVWKELVPGRHNVGKLNVGGDGQGDLRGHGGEQRAILVYQMDFLSLLGKAARAKGLRVRTIRRELHGGGIVRR